MQEAQRTTFGLSRRCIPHKLFCRTPFLACALRKRAFEAHNAASQLSLLHHNVCGAVSACTRVSHWSKRCGIAAGLFFFFRVCMLHNLLDCLLQSRGLVLVKTNVCTTRLCRSNTQTLFETVIPSLHRHDFDVQISYKSMPVSQELSSCCDLLRHFVHVKVSNAKQFRNTESASCL